MRTYITIILMTAFMSSAAHSPDSLCLAGSSHQAELTFNAESPELFKSTDNQELNDSLIDSTGSDITDPSGQSVAYTAKDTVWLNPVNGTRVHLQRFGGLDTLDLPSRNVIKPITESLAINFGVWGYDHFIRNEGWADVDIHNIRHNLKCTWVLDHDSYSGNQFSHPFHGSIFYNAARYHGHTYYESALYPLIGSCVWEYFCETNEPSYNDFLSTGIGGSALGEATYRVSDIVYDNTKRGFNRVIRELVGGLLNPARGFHRMFSGEMFRVSHDTRGKRVSPEPFSLDVGVGYRHIKEMRHERREKHIPYIDFLLTYGEHFDGKTRHKPYDFFRLYAQLNLSGDDPTFSDIDLRGRILSHQFSSPCGWRFDTGLYQVYKYVDNYGVNGKTKSRMKAGDFSFVNEACSFGWGFYAEKESRKISFSNDFMADAVAFGGTMADHFTPRTYNFASGLSIRNEMRFCINNRIVVGDEFYFARMYMFKGSKTGDPDDYNRWYWGDKGNTSIFRNKAYLHLFLNNVLKLNAEHTLFYRRANYEVYPSHHGKSYELRLGLIYSI